jgi:hypothetical protein
MLGPRRTLLRIAKTRTACSSPTDETKQTRNLASSEDLIKASANELRERLHRPAGSCTKLQLYDSGHLFQLAALAGQMTNTTESLSGTSSLTTGRIVEDERIIIRSFSLGELGFWPSKDHLRHELGVRRDTGSRLQCFPPPKSTESQNILANGL